MVRRSSTGSRAGNEAKEEIRSKFVQRHNSIRCDVLISFKSTHCYHIYTSFVAMLSLNAAKRIAIFPRAAKRVDSACGSGSGSGSSASAAPATPESKCNKNALTDDQGSFEFDGKES
jgi:hypothetical protein